MPGMNWDRVRREKPLIEDYDYSRLMDERDRGIVFGHDTVEAWERLAARREREGRPAPPPEGGMSKRQLKQARRAKSAVAPAVTPGGRKASPAPPSGSKKQAAKAKRDIDEARRLGVSLEKLRAIRREEAHQLAALKKEAVRRGLTMKQLKRVLTAEAEARRNPPARRTGPVISRTGRALGKGRKP